MQVELRKYQIILLARQHRAQVESQWVGKDAAVPRILVGNHPEEQRWELTNIIPRASWCSGGQDDGDDSSPFDISKSNLNDSVNDNNDNNNNSNNNHDDGTENDDDMDVSADKADINKDAQDEHQPRLTPKSLSSLTGRTSPPRHPHSMFFNAWRVATLSS